MTDAEFSIRTVEVLGQEGPRSFLREAMREAQEALTEHGFEFGAPDSSGPNEPEWLLESVASGSRLRLVVQMLDPSQGSVLTVRANVCAHLAPPSGRQIYSWLDAAMLGSSAYARFGVRQKLFGGSPGDPSRVDSGADELLLLRLSGGCALEVAPDLAALSTTFARRVSVVMAP